MVALCDSAKCRAGTGGSDNRQAQLLNRVLAHDHVAFREIVEQLQAKVFSVCFALLGDAQEADISAQKTFARLYRAARRIDPRQDLNNAIYRIAVLQCLDSLKNRRTRSVLRRLTSLRLMIAADNLPIADEKGGRALLLRGLSTLPDLDRALIVLREVAKQSVEDTAEIMQMDSATVRQRLLLARQRLRTSLTA